MARAAAEPKWILLSEATARVENFYQSRELAERRLRQWLLAGKLRWRSECLEGSKQSCDPDSGAPEFWRYPGSDDPEVWHYETTTFNFGGRTPTISITPSMVITWEESWARRRGYTFYRIEVAANDLAKLLPVGDVVGDGASTKAWITAEVKRMKIAGEIRPGIKITYFARELKRRMDKAVRAGTVKKSVGWKYIKDCLPRWGLWPISSIN